MMVFEEGDQSGPATAVAQWNPVQLVKHVIDAGCLAMSVDDPACRPVLDTLDLVDVFVMKTS
jgi:hypothetical protein